MENSIIKTTILLILLMIISFQSMANKRGENLENKLILDSIEIEPFNTQIISRTNQQSLKALGGTSVINGHVQDTDAVNRVGHDVTLYELVANELTFVSAEITDGNGDYSFTGLTAGIYLIFVGSQTDDYLDYIWQSDSPFLCNFPHFCSQIPTSHINLPDSAILNGFDFTIAIGAHIQGTIIDAASLNGVGTLTVQLADTDLDLRRNYLFSSIVDQATGSYSINGIPDGAYLAYLEPRFDLDNIHISQVYGGPECNLCIREAAFQGLGTVLNIISSNNLNNINYTVNVGASINGFILDNNTVNPLIGFSTLRVYSELNNLLGIKTIDGTNSIPTANGSYILGGLLPGSFYVQVDDGGRDFYQRELYNNKPCYFSGCNRGSGDAVVLAAQENRQGVNFLLDKGGKIAGTVTDASTGLPIVSTSFNPQVEFYNNVEEVVGSAFIQNDGSYVSARALPAGLYSVRTGSMFQGELLQPYVNQKYMGIDCAGLACDLSNTNIVVSNDSITSGIDFALSTGNSFSGTVTDLTSSAPIGGVHVLVYKEMSAGVVKFANWATTSDGSNGVPIGEFVVSGLPDGTYFARTGYGSDLPFFVSTFHNIGGPAPMGWIDILYDGFACMAGCDVTLGTPIVLPVSTSKAFGSSVVNFSLNQGGIITGKVTEFIKHIGLKEITVNVYNNQGVFMGSSITDDQGNYITRGLPTGNYYLTTTSFDVLLDVKYGNDFCTPGTCNPLDANPISVTESLQTLNKDFVIKTAYMHMFSDDFE